MQEDAPMGEAAAAAGTGGRPLNLRQIEVFRAIMMSGSISAAGRALHVSQPAVSRVLALTESRLGYALFERVKSRLVPTPEARRLYGEVERVYGGIQRVNDLAASLGQHGAGALRVVASATFGQWLVPHALQRLLQRHPQVRVDYRSVTFDEMEGYFLSGRADVGLSISQPEHPNLTAQKLGTAQTVCVLPADHPLCRKTHVGAADLSAGVPWIGYPPDTPLGRALRPFLESGPASPAAIEVHSPVTALAFVQQGLGPALVDRYCVAGEPGARIVVRPIEPAVQVDIWATHSNLESLPLLGKRFLTAVAGVLAQA
ncbi:LysR substrate-binding domain-containing protein [Orrella sp. JC864]|uniref:LysR family transcriptional regulator n=1 Tax=Orrella sp. JC864 TaxID=3120298 RepID=UPI00300A55D5